MDSAFYNFPRYDIIENDKNIKTKSHWNNEGEILILVTDEYEREELKSLLHKILAAIQSNESNTSIIQIPKNERIKVIDLSSYENCHTVIIMGIRPLEIGLNLQHKLFELNRLNGRNILFSPGLDDLNDNMEFKKHLWAALKEHFT